MFPAQVQYTELAYFSSFVAAHQENQVRWETGELRCTAGVETGKGRWLVVPGKQRYAVAPVGQRQQPRLSLVQERRRHKTRRRIGFGDWLEVAIENQDIDVFFRIAVEAIG